MKLSFLYQAALVASLMLAGGCTKEDVQADKSLLTETDKARVEALQSLGLKEGYTLEEYQSFLQGFSKLNGPELDYFNELVKNWSIAYIKKNAPAAEQEPAIKTLELKTEQKRQLNDRSIRTFGKPYLQLSEQQFNQVARQAGLAWDTSEKSDEPTGRTTANPGCGITWYCNKTLNYSNSGTSSGHPFDQGVFTSVYDAFTGKADCDVGFQASCTAQTTHLTITSTRAYYRTMLEYPKPAGFAGGPFSSQTPTTSIRRILLGNQRLSAWGIYPNSFAADLRLF